MADSLVFDLKINTGEASKAIQKLQKEIQGIGNIKPPKVAGGAFDPLDRMTKNAAKNVEIANKYIERMRVQFDRMGDEGVQAFAGIETKIRTIAHEMRHLPSGLLRQHLAEIGRTDITPLVDGFHGLGNSASKAANKTGKSWGKLNSNLFQFQQTIEDFKFAGMQGATNNLAMMASTLTGPAGLIALGGILGVTVLPQMAEGLVGVEAAAAQSTARLDAMLGSVKGIIDQQEKAYQMNKQLIDKPVEQAEKEREERMSEIDHTQGQLRRYESQEAIFDEAAQIQKELDIARGQEGTIPKDQTDALRKRIQDFRSRANKAGILDPNDMIYQSSGWGFDKAFRGGYGLPEDILPSGKLPQSPDNEAFVKRRGEAAQAAEAERQRLQGLRTEIKAIEEYLGKAKEKAAIDMQGAGTVGSTPVGAVGTPPGSGATTNNHQSSTVINNNYTTQVNGLPSRPSLTLREIAAATARQAAASKMRTGFA